MPNYLDIQSFSKLENGLRPSTIKTILIERTEQSVSL